MAQELKHIYMACQEKVFQYVQDQTSSFALLRLMFQAKELELLKVQAKRMFAPREPELLQMQVKKVIHYLFFRFLSSLPIMLPPTQYLL